MTARPYNADPWALLRKFTQARIGLGNVGGSLPTRPWLEFQLAHAQARDAVHLVFEAEDLASQMRKRGWQTVVVASAARDRSNPFNAPKMLNATARIPVGTASAETHCLVCSIRSTVSSRDML